MKFLYMLSLNLFTIVSCGNLNNTEHINTLDIISGTYHITDIAEFNALPENLTIAFDTITNRVSGFSGCNRFFGTFIIEGNTITFNKIASTKMFCKPEANQVESQILQWLEKVNSFSLKGNILKLNSDKNTLIKGVQNKDQEISASIVYYASSRRSYKFISVNKKTISLSEKRDVKLLRKPCDKAIWNNITSALKPIEIEDIPNLEPPSKRHQFDGAALARLKITFKGKTYETQPFDHGNPPEKIAVLVKEILSISENIE